MTLKKNIKLSTYSCNLIISVVDSVAKSVDILYKKYKINGMFGSEAEGAVASMDLQNYYLLFHKDFLTHNTIAHEIYHATVRISEDRDVTDEQAQAWLAGYITGMVYEFLEKKKVQVKHG